MILLESNRAVDFITMQRISVRDSNELVAHYVTFFLASEHIQRGYHYFLLYENFISSSPGMDEDG